jgi:RNA polymerase sigma-70 factor (sigma-E family)
VEDVEIRLSPDAITGAPERTVRPSFDEYVAARSPALLRLAALIVGDSGVAEDLVQETLIRVYPRWKRIDSEDPDRYVRRALARNAVSLWRRRRHVGREVSCPNVPETPVAEWDDVDPSGVVWETVRRLPRRQRAVVVLAFYADMSEAQIAAELGCAVGTVKSQKSRALRQVKARLESMSEAKARHGYR